jgi:hypothetical protein
LNETCNRVAKLKPSNFKIVMLARLAGETRYLSNRIRDDSQS